MSLIRTLFICTVFISGIWLLWENNPSFRDAVQSYVENGEFLTLEARYSAEQIMKSHEKELIPDSEYRFQDPQLKFHPYLLMEVKYTQPSGKTREGVILWSMVDGEMVLDTDTWQKTHGFEDAINAGANRSDFVLMNTLAKYRGSLPLSRLQKELKLEDQAFKQLIENGRRKYLIILRENQAALHFENPYFLVAPKTNINQWLVTKPYDKANRISKRYSQKQIEKVAKAAFGHDFTVRSAKVAFLPVYSIEVLNPDGSVLTSYWNALNGNRINDKYLSISPY